MRQADGLLNKSAASLVLVVDDDPMIRAVVSAALEDDGHTAIEAEDGAEALRYLQQQRVDVIILDLDMPVMDGRTFWRLLQEQGQHIPTLILSAHRARSAARELGAGGWLEKPFDTDDLIKRIRSLRRLDGAEREAPADSSRASAARTNIR